MAHVSPALPSLTLPTSARLGSLILLAWSCGGPSASGPAPPRPAAAVAEPASPEATQRATAPAVAEPPSRQVPGEPFVSQRFAVELAAPSGGRWRLRPNEHWFWVEEQQRDASLRVRTFAVGREQGRAACAEALALWSPRFGAVTQEQVVERRRLELPPGFDAELVVSVQEHADAVSGQAALFGKGRRDCLVAVFETRVDGSGAAERVAARLAWAVDRWLPSLRRWDVEDRVERSPPP